MEEEEEEEEDDEEEEEEVEEIWPETDVELNKLEQLLPLTNFCGSLPSRRKISGRILLLALMNHLLTCFSVSCVLFARTSFSARVG